MKQNDSAVEQYWASFFGVATEDLEINGVRVVAHAALNGYHGAWVFNHQHATIISVPRDQVDAVDDVARTAQPAHPRGDFFSPSFLRSMFPVAVERTIGPAYQGYVDMRRFRGRDDSSVRLANNDDREALKRLEEACAAVEWEHASISPDDDRLYIRVRDGEIVAAARAKKQDGIYPNIGIITHPLHRGKGHAVAVASAASADALTRDSVVLWQTLMNNAGSITIAERLGFVRFAESMAVRFK